MERYQAVLDQLKKAQSRGMETINNRLDFVVQSLEELIQEAKSSVQGALPQSPEECLPVDEVEQALLELRNQLDAQQQRADALTARLAELEADGQPAAPGSSIHLLRTLDGARSQSELLREMLPALSERVARAVVLVLRDGTATAWSGIGFADAELLRSWRSDVAESPALSRVLENSNPVRLAPGDDPAITGWLAGEQPPEEALLIPVVLRGKLMGAVYVDRLADQPWEPESAQTLVAQVCWLIDTLQFRSTGAPALAEPVELGAAPAAEARTLSTAPQPVIPPEPDDAEPTEAAPGYPPEDPSVTMKVDLPEPGDQSAEPPAEEDEQPAEPESVELAADSFEPDEPEAPQPALDEPDATEFEPAESEFEPGAAQPAEHFEPDEPAPAEAVEPDAPDAVDEVQAVEPPADVRPVEPPAEEDAAPEGSQFLDEPPPVQPVQPPAEQPTEEVSADEAQREEARRFARLLVSEIKLYNEEQVERGREARDLYSRLQEDIDRSREMFDKRIAPEVRAQQDYFKDELVRILADGNPDLLGM